MQKTWHDLDTASKPSVSVEVMTLDGASVASFSALIDTGSRWSVIPGIMVSQDPIKRTMEVDLQLPSRTTRRMTVPADKKEEFGIWLSGPQARYGSCFALRFGQHVVQPVTLFFAPAPRAMKPHLILGCDLLFGDNGLCIDRAANRFRLGICRSPSDVPR
jgi:hypothetical protein